MLHSVRIRRGDLVSHPKPLQPGTCSHPYHLSVDQVSSYIIREMKSNNQADRVSLDEAAVENPGAIGTIERYHEPMRAAFVKVADAPS